MKAMTRKFGIVCAFFLLCAMGAGAQSAKKSIEGYWTLFTALTSFNIHFGANGQYTDVTLSLMDTDTKDISKGTYSVSGNKILSKQTSGSGDSFFGDGAIEFYMPNNDTLELCDEGMIMVFTRTNDYAFRDIK